MNDNNLLNVSVQNRKYTVTQNAQGELQALRHGEEWRDCTGDNLILALAQTVERLQTTIDKATNCLVCSGIADPSEICSTAYDILNGETK